MGREDRREYGSPLTADTSPGNDVAFSPDGRALVSSDQRSVVVWDMSGGQAIGQPLGEPTDLITDVSFSPDGKRLVAGQVDGDTVEYDTATRRQVLRIAGGSVVTSVAYALDGKQIAVGTIDGKVRLFDPKSGAAIGSPLDVGQAAIWQVAFSPDGRLLAVAVDPNGAAGFDDQRRQGEVQLWDVESRRRVGRIRPGAGSVLSLAFNHGGTLLATGSYRRRVDLWDVATQARHGKSMKVADDGFPSVTFDPSGEFVAAGGAIGPVRVWRVANQRPAFPPSPGTPAPSPQPRSARMTSSWRPLSVRRHPALGSGNRPRLRRRAGGQRQAGVARAEHRLSVPGLGTRSVRTASCWPSQESTGARCCGTSTLRSGAGARVWPPAEI